MQPTAHTESASKGPDREADEIIGQPLFQFVNCAGVFAKQGNFSPVKSPVRIPSLPYLGVLRQSPTVSKLLEVWNHRSVSR